MILGPLLTFLIWLGQQAIEALYIPVSIIRLFKTSTRCPPIKNKILLISATDLAHRIRTKQLSCVEVVEAYIQRINDVNPIINAVIENRFKEALYDAEAVDKFLNSTNLDVAEIESKFPLLGVPITVKGSIAVKGLLHSAGRIDHSINATTDADAVKLVKKAGAIPLLISNVPELCLNWETTNKLIGTTSNPYDTTRTPGGSSGGEASLMGCGASLLGLGSDVAGSLRLPAHCCGIFAHKPSPLAVSTVGHYPDCVNTDDWVKIFTMGPMARYADDLKLLFSIILEPDMKNVLKLEQTVDVKKLKIFYMNDPRGLAANKFNKSVVTAIEKVVTHFDGLCESKCTNVDIPLMKHSPELSTMCMLHIQGVDNVFEDKQTNYLKELVKSCSGQTDHELNSVLFEILLRLVPALSRSKKKQVFGLLQNLRDGFIEMLGEDGVFIFPTSPTEASYHWDYFRKLGNVGYLAIFNAMGLPATACPVMFTKRGLPIGLQIVAAPNMDRLTLSVAAEIEKAFGGWKFS